MSRINVRLSLAATLHKDGPTPAAELEEAALLHGVSRHALRGAATSLGVETSGGVWKLPDVVIPFLLLGGTLHRKIPTGNAA
jgi:hypothetical protein